MSKELTVSNNNLTIYTKENNLIIAKSMIKVKPKLVKYIECKKIREYSKEEQIHRNSYLITYILSLLGISDKTEEKEQHYIAVDLFIEEELNNYSYEEIKEAFKMYVKGVFNESFEKILYKLDCIILFKVMNCYDLKKSELTRVYNQKLAKNMREIEEKQNQLNDKEKEKLVLQGLKEAYTDYKELGIFNEIGRLYLYDFLFRKNVLPKDKKTKDAVMIVAVKNIEKKRELALTKEDKVKLQIMSSDDKYSNTVINECRRISIIRCFDNFAKYKQLLKKIQNV